MAYFKFLGTGGGRYVLISQVRATGGAYLESGKLRLYIDPGPGALVHSIRKNVKLSKLNALFVSHNHADHRTDTEVIIEAATNGCTRKKDFFLIGSKNVINSVDDYHKRACSGVFALSPGESVKIAGCKLTATKAIHTEKTCIGFVLEAKEKIGYTADTLYFSKLTEIFRNCDVLIVNCTVPRNPYKHKEICYARHMDAFDVTKLLREAKPNLAILWHYGRAMLRADPEKIAKRIEKKSGVKTLAVKDFQEISTN